MFIPVVWHVYSSCVPCLLLLCGMVLHPVEKISPRLLRTVLIVELVFVSWFIPNEDIANHTSDFREMVRLLKYLVRGLPHSKTESSTYWRNRTNKCESIHNL